MKKRYHSVVAASSQGCRSAIKRTCVMLQVETVKLPATCAGIPTILSFLQFIWLGSIPGAFFSS